MLPAEIVARYPTYEHDGIALICGDCLEVLPMLEDKVEAIITDLPYGTTACSWDEIIPFAPMWAQVKRLLKPRGAFVTTASQPFTSKLIMSNLDWFKYEWIWKKDKSSGHLDAQRKPLKAHENIAVFSRNGNSIYNYQLSLKPKINIRPLSIRKNTAVYRSFDSQAKRLISKDKSFPSSVINFNKPNIGEQGFHPTQKPEALYRYLILTYTNPGDTVMDFVFGSGTTGVACVQTGRRFIGIEISEDYYNIAVKRIKTAQLQIRMDI